MADIVKIKYGDKEIELSETAVLALLKEKDDGLKTLADSNSQIGDKAKANETRAEQAERELAEANAKLQKPADTSNKTVDYIVGGYFDPDKFEEWQKKHDEKLIERVKTTLAPDIARVNSNVEIVSDEAMRNGMKQFLGDGASDDEINTAVAMGKKLNTPLMVDFIAKNFPDSKIKDIPQVELNLIFKNISDGKIRLSQGKHSARPSRPQDVVKTELDFAGKLKEFGFSDKDIAEAEAHIKETGMSEKEYLERMQGQSGGHKRNE